MKGLESFIKNAGFAQNFEDKFGFSKTLDLITSRKRFSKNFFNSELEDSFLKNIVSFQKTFIPPYYNNDGIRNLLALAQKNSIPHSVLESISLISKNQLILLENLKGASPHSFINSSVFSQVQSLQGSMDKIASQIAVFAAKQHNWASLEHFENITQTATTLTEEPGVTEEGLSILQELVNQATETYKDNKYLLVQAIKYISVLLTLLGLYDFYASHIKAQPETITKKEFSILKSELFKKLEEQLKKENEYRVTNRDCIVRLKPKTNSIVLFRLPHNFEVSILQINHKWAYISYYNPKDNLPESGWVLKKYLNKPNKK